nr:hypothetical protein CTI12_AA056890 [Tanacetum cinerariifolium]
GKGIINYNILKLVVTAVDNVKEKVKELGIERLKVSTTVSLGFITGNESVAKGLFGTLNEKDVTLFVHVKHWNVSLGSSFKEVVCGGFALKRDLSNDVSYVGLDNGEMMMLK